MAGLANGAVHPIVMDSGRLLSPSPPPDAGEAPPRATSPVNWEDPHDPGAHDFASPDRISTTVIIRRIDADDPGSVPSRLVGPGAATAAFLPIPSTPSQDRTAIRPDQPGDDLEHRYDQVLEEADSEDEQETDAEAEQREVDRAIKESLQSAAVEDSGLTPAAIFLENQRAALEHLRQSELVREMAKDRTLHETEEQQLERRTRDEDDIKERIEFEAQRQREAEEKRKKEEQEAMERKAQEDARRRAAMEQDERASRALAELKKRASERHGVVGESEDIVVAAPIGESSSLGSPGRQPTPSPRQPSGSPAAAASAPVPHTSASSLPPPAAGSRIIITHADGSVVSSHSFTPSSALNPYSPAKISPNHLAIDESISRPASSSASFQSSNLPMAISTPAKLSVDSTAEFSSAVAGDANEKGPALKGCCILL